MELILTGIIWAFKKVWPVPITFLILGLALFFILKGFERSNGSGLEAIRNKVGIATLVLTVFSIPFVIALRPSITVPMINLIGVEAEGRVISSHQTADVHNYKNVIAYKVVYRSVSGELVESQFRTSDFNVYPQSNTVRYPQVGDTFNLKYLSLNPEVFIILASSTSQSEECRYLLRYIAELEEVLLEQPDNPELVEELEELKARHQAMSDC